MDLSLTSSVPVAATPVKQDRVKNIRPRVLRLTHPGH